MNKASRALVNMTEFVVVYKGVIRSLGVPIIDPQRRRIRGCHAAFAHAHAFPLQAGQQQLVDDLIGWPLVKLNVRQSFAGLRPLSLSPSYREQNVVRRQFSRPTRKYQAAR